jgi:hypothetical protein
MPLVEVDEVELQRSRKAREFIETIWNNPRAKRKLLEAQKEVKPDDPLVKELENEDPVQAQLSALNKRFEDAEKARADAEAEREQATKIAQFRSVKDAGISELKRAGWTDKGIEGVEKLMEEKGILDPLDAAAIWEKHNPPPTPVTPNAYGGWNFMESSDGMSEDLKKLIETRGESNPLIDKMARDALADIRGPQRR